MYCCSSINDICYLPFGELYHPPQSILRALLVWDKIQYMICNKMKFDIIFAITFLYSICYINDISSHNIIKSINYGDF